MGFINNCAYLLNACIQIESTKINRRISVAHRVSFCLDKQLLTQIERVMADKSRLELSASNLANLRHYALSNIPLLIYQRQNGREVFNDFSLTFATQYLAAENEPIVTLFQSEIDLEGKISQQITQSTYQNSSLLAQISQAHYWLVLEILTQLPLKPKTWYRWFIVACLALVIAIACGFIWYFVSLAYPFKITICLGLIGLAKFAFKPLILPNLKSWVIYHLLDGYFAKRLYKKRIGLKILSFIVAFNRP